MGGAAAIAAADGFGISGDFCQNVNGFWIAAKNWACRLFGGSAEGVASGSSGVAGAGGCPEVMAGVAGGAARDGAAGGALSHGEVDGVTAA